MFSYKLTTEQKEIVEKYRSHITPPNKNEIRLKREFRELFKKEREKEEKSRKELIESYRKEYGGYFRYLIGGEIIHIPIERKYFPSEDRVNVMCPQIQKDLSVIFYSTLIDSLEKPYTSKEYIAKYCYFEDSKYFLK